MGKKTGICAAIDALPWLVKILFCIPVLDIIWAVYRIIKGIEKSSVLLIIIGILWIVPGAAFLWVVDIVTTIIFGKPILS